MYTPGIHYVAQQHSVLLLINKAKAKDYYLSLPTTCDRKKNSRVVKIMSHLKMGDFHGDDKEPYYADFTKPKGCEHAQIIVFSVLMLRACVYSYD